MNSLSSSFTDVLKLSSTTEELQRCPGLTHGQEQFKYKINLKGAALDKKKVKKSRQKYNMPKLHIRIAGADFS